MKETLRCEWVKCGRKCSGCPHGPYWYAYWREGGRLRKRYVGKTLPGSSGQDGNSESRGLGNDGPAGDPRAAIFNERTASRRLALEIMGLPGAPSMKELKGRLRELVRVNHPDCGGSRYEMSLINASYGYLRVSLNR